MKFVSLFHDVSTANNFRILNIPWIGWEKSKKKALHYKKTNGKIIADNENIDIFSFTFLYLNNNEIVDITAKTELTSDLLSAYKNTLVKCEIDPNITSIGNYAFYEFSNLKEVIIPNSVTSIGYEVFTSCTSLTSINIPNSVTSIGSSAFASCTSLTSINIPNSVTSIGSSAFIGCTSLSSIYVPSSVITIDGWAFGDGIETVILQELKNSYNVNIFNALSAVYTSVRTHSLIIENVAPDTFSNDYNCSVILQKGESGDKSATLTYNIYTDNQTVHDQMAAAADNVTIINLYHLDESPWA